MDRFPMLSMVSQLLRLIGWLTVIGAVIMAMLTLSGQGPVFGDTTLSWLGAVLVLTGGMTTVAFGESIGVLFAIEENTRSENHVGAGNQSLGNHGIAPTMDGRPPGAMDEGL